MSFATLVIILVCLANIVLGFLVLQRRPKNTESRWFFAVTGFLVLWILSTYFATNDLPLEICLWLVRTSYIWASSILLGFLLFVVNLIADKTSWLYRKRVSVATVGFLIALSSLTPLVVPYIVPAEHGGVDEGVGILKIPFLIFVLLLIFVIFLTMRRYIRLRTVSAQRRAQSRLILVGIVLSFIFGFTFNALIPLVTGDFSTARFGALSMTFLTVFVAIAMVRHRHFDIRLVVVRSLAYIISLAILAVVYATATFAITSLFFRGSEPSVEQQISYIVLALLLALTFYPLKKRFDSITAKIFYREAYDSQRVLDVITGTLVRNSSLTDMSELVLKHIAGALRPTFAGIIVCDQDNKVIKTISIGGWKVREATAIVQSSKKLQRSILVVDEMELKSTHLSKILREEQVAVVAKLQTSKETVGYLILGHKNSGNIYTSQDIDLTRIVSDELAVAIQNSLRFEEIQRFNETLQEKVDAATDRLRRANTRLKQLDATKDEFVSMASHQLRTPLTSIKGYLSMVLEGDAGDLNPTQEKLLREAFTSSERMVRLIGDFLNVSRLRTGRFMVERKPVDMADLVAAEVSQLRPTAATRELQLAYEQPANFPEIDLDKGKIQQVVMNLIDNAIFYSQPRGVIMIELFKKQNDIIFRVKDRGIGVPAEEKKRLFTKFYRATNARRQRPDGTGIGLFMAQKVVVAHGGSIIFESTEGEGSTFGFRLPITLSADDAARAAAMAEKDITAE